MCHLFVTIMCYDHCDHVSMYCDHVSIHCDHVIMYRDHVIVYCITGTYTGEDIYGDVPRPLSENI